MKQIKVVVKPDAVREALLKMNKDLGRLAGEVSISNGYLSELMNNDRSPSAKLRERLMKALNVDDWDVLFKIKPDDIDETSQPMPI